MIYIKEQYPQGEITIYKVEADEWRIRWNDVWVPVIDYPGILRALEEAAEQGHSNQGCVREDGATIPVYFLITEEEAAMIIFEAKD